MKLVAFYALYLETKLQMRDSMNFISKDYNDYEVQSFVQQTDEKPDVGYSDIGGMDIQKQEVREAVELPLTHFELYKQIGIDPPRGVLMFGPPGCGKTMLAKAVAHHTTGSHLAYMLYCKLIDRLTVSLQFKQSCCSQAYWQAYWVII